MDVELLEDPGEVVPDGLLAEEQRGRNLAVGLAGRDFGRDLVFASAQCRKPRPPRGRSGATWGVLAQPAQLASGSVSFAAGPAREQGSLGVRKLADTPCLIAAGDQCESGELAGAR